MFPLSFNSLLTQLSSFHWQTQRQACKQIHICTHPTLPPTRAHTAEAKPGLARNKSREDKNGMAGLNLLCRPGQFSTENRARDLWIAKYISIGVRVSINVRRHRLGVMFFCVLTEGVWSTSVSLDLTLFGRATCCLSTQSYFRFSRSIFSWRWEWGEGWYRMEHVGMISLHISFRFFP